MSKEPSHGLRYAEPRELHEPGRIRAIAIISIIFGVMLLGVNVLIASAMFGQLLKNWRGTTGVSQPGTGPWLVLGAIDSALSCVLAIYLMVAAAMTLHRPARAQRLHRSYARLKLPLAIVFGIWLGWALPTNASIDLISDVIFGALGFLASAAYPLYLLDTFRKPAQVLDDIR